MDYKRKLLNEVGLSVNKKGEYIDQDTMQHLKIKNRVAKEYNIRRNEIEFDPLTNSKHAEELVKYCDIKDNLNILSFGTNVNSDGTVISTITTPTNKYESKGYNNPALAIAENIFKLYGEEVDLSEIDIIKEDENDTSK